MNLDDFSSLCGNIVDKEFPTKIIPIVFCISIKPQQNEVFSERHLQLFFEEFLEAYSRIVDRLSPIPDGEIPEDWPLNSRQEQHLSIKLLNTLPMMLGSLKEEFRPVKEKFTIPPKDDYGLYTFDINSGFYQNSYPKNLHK